MANTPDARFPISAAMAQVRALRTAFFPRAGKWLPPWCGVPCDIRWERHTFVERRLSGAPGMRLALPGVTRYSHG